MKGTARRLAAAAIVVTALSLGGAGMVHANHDAARPHISALRMVNETQGSRYGLPAPAARPAYRVSPLRVANDAAAATTARSAPAASHRVSPMRLANDPAATGTAARIPSYKLSPVRIANDSQESVAALLAR